jgi:hypothetical protein
MKDETVSQFQDKVAQLLIRHRSIVDSMTKFQESTAKVNRSVAKTVTHCGCLSINATRQSYPPEADLKECGKFVVSHLQGELCEHCREVLEEVLGNHLFYLTALCHLLNTDLSEVISKEFERLSTLGHFKLC